DALETRVDGDRRILNGAPYLSPRCSPESRRVPGARHRAMSARTAAKRALVVQRRVIRAVPMSTEFKCGKRQRSDRFVRKIVSREDGRSAGHAKARRWATANEGKVQTLAYEPSSESRSILFLFSDTGGGHRASAQAIDAGLRGLDGADFVPIHHVDAFASCGTFPLREGVASYGSMLKVQPSPYPAIYHLTNGRTRFRVIAELGKPFIRRNFRRMLQELRPDLVVSVHPLLNVYARQLIDASGLRAPLVTVITDLV